MAVFKTVTENQTYIAIKTHVGEKYLYRGGCITTEKSESPLMFIQLGICITLLGKTNKQSLRFPA